VGDTCLIERKRTHEVALLDNIFSIIKRTSRPLNLKSTCFSERPVTSQPTPRNNPEKSISQPHVRHRTAQLVQLLYVTQNRIYTGFFPHIRSANIWRPEQTTNFHLKIDACNAYSSRCSDYTVRLPNLMDNRSNIFIPASVM
jgi:hypothetical protein